MNFKPVQYAIFSSLCLFLFLSFLFGCQPVSSKTDPGYYFLTVEDKNAVYDTAILVDAKLVIISNCFILKHVDSGTTYLPIWPYGYSYQEINERVEILNSDNQVVLGVGQIIDLGGSSSGQKNLPKHSIEDGSNFECQFDKVWHSAPIYTFD